MPVLNLSKIQLKKKPAPDRYESSSPNLSFIQRRDSSNFGVTFNNSNGNNEHRLPYIGGVQGSGIDSGSDHFTSISQRLERQH